jgi:hypothetical protein
MEKSILKKNKEDAQKFEAESEKAGEEFDRRFA